MRYVELCGVFVFEPHVFEGYVFRVVRQVEVLYLRLESGAWQRVVELQQTVRVGRVQETAGRVFGRGPIREWGEGRSIIGEHLINIFNLFVGKGGGESKYG